MIKTQIEMMGLFSELCGYIGCVPLCAKNSWEAISVRKNKFAISMASGSTPHELLQNIINNLRKDPREFINELGTENKISLLMDKVYIINNRKAQMIEDQLNLFVDWNCDFYLAE